MEKVAKWAAGKGWPLPVPQNPLDMLTKQFADAAREETRKDTTTVGLSGILCAGPVSSEHEALAEDDGELCFGLEPLARRPLPFLGGMVEDEV